MAWLLYIDESGHDQGKSPYEVLAGFAVEDKVLGRLIRQLDDAQEHHFGFRYFRELGVEAKATKLLKKKTFRIAGQRPAIPINRRRLLAKAALLDGANIEGEQLIALCQAKIEYCRHILEICRSHDCVAFASIIRRGLPRPSGDFLRKDYSFFFERFHHFLGSRKSLAIGILVFDEIEKAKSHILLNQIDGYFRRTTKGQRRSRLIIPEPLFVHSDQTTMIQMADIVAYVISWGVRIRWMDEPNRPELNELVEQVLDLRYHRRTPGGTGTWGFKVIESLMVGKGSSRKGKGNANLSAHKASKKEYGP